MTGKADGWAQGAIFETAGGTRRIDDARWNLAPARVEPSDIPNTSAQSTSADIWPLRIAKTRLGSQKKSPASDKYHFPALPPTLLLVVI
jgi:hypothetical protein